MFLYNQQSICTYLVRFLLSLAGPVLCIHRLIYRNFLFFLRQDESLLFCFLVCCYCCSAGAAAAAGAGAAAAAATGAGGAVSFHSVFSSIFLLKIAIS